MAFSRWATALLTLTTMLPGVAAAGPDGATTATLKAAFLINFARFVEWPSAVLPADAPLVICVTGDDQVAKSVDTLTSRGSTGSHSMRSRRVSVDEFHGCHLWYVAGLNAARAVQLLASLKSELIFTVSDFDEFATLGGTANLFLERNKLRFAINVDSAGRANLRVSSKLLALATIVHGPPP